MNDAAIEETCERMIELSEQWEVESKKLPHSWAIRRLLAADALRFKQAVHLLRTHKKEKKDG